MIHLWIFGSYRVISINSSMSADCRDVRASYIAILHNMAYMRASKNQGSLAWERLE